MKLKIIKNYPQQMVLFMQDMGCKFFIMKSIFLFLILLFSFGMSNCLCQESNVIGKYKYIPLAELPSDSVILELKENGKFVFSPFINNGLGYIVLCDKTEGTWVVENGDLILNSNIPSDNPNDLIKISPFEKKDSIKLEIFKYSDSTPASIGFPLFNKGTFLSEYMTDSLGIIIIPISDCDDISLCLDHLCKNVCKIKPNKGGYYYQITYFDCFPEVFNNEKLKIDGNKLIRTIMSNDSNQKIKKSKLKEVYIKQY